MMNKYEELINLPYNGSKRKNKMPLINRAAQFAPFSALTGYNDAIKEAARIVDTKIELEESEIEELNHVLQEIGEGVNHHPLVQITYFMQDQNKNGGVYQTVEERVKKIDEIKKEIILMNGLKIKIQDVRELVLVDSTSIVR